MELAITSAAPDAAAPELIRQLRLIFAGLVDLIARRFLRDPACVALLVPLCLRLRRALGRLERALLRPAGGIVAGVRRRGPVKVAVAPTRPAVRLPGGFGWLVRRLGWEAAGYGSQLAHLLEDPAMRAALQALPAVGRILRPIARMLGVTPPAKVVPQSEGQEVEVSPVAAEYADAPCPPPPK